MMAVVVPNIRNLLPGKERKLFIERLNGLTRLGWQRAIVEHKLQKIAVDIKNRKIWLESATGSLKEGQPEFKRAKGA